MAQHAYPGRRSGAELQTRLRAAPAGLASDAEAEAKGEIARVLAVMLERLVAEWACNKNLRAAVTCFADNSRHASTWADAIYTKARGRGCKHAHAVRILARAWVRVLWRAWQDGEPYDPASHAGAARLA